MAHDRYCILCEAEDLGKVKAKYLYKVDFTGELVPVCEDHLKELKEEQQEFLEDYE